ncbi:MAG TPA: cytochrome c oxidase subunit 3 [Nitrosomonas nitrosa]|uniref:cytochrome-c oxidase n=1 Tax=Nitrosomonas nitrosa TaxID=52442 RepID=A0A1I4NXF0_9PROT|nr:MULTISPECIES: cytochrome c oxidase subunit 3 [Nitrosomonas]MCO6435046.1 cytochrome c oxidase subunit 3 [Nitrosomonas nitrosa]MCW5601022.1 cytochrome c oxidase subunit 3 [Nitrosomonas sp.]SFM20234.1 cytochrome c oxidase subunit 3 [Nitrosomonas nitrosa]HBZ29163.1 cytochrome c oxidase subunit 3 [Nitrosomonas nitrosa]HNP50251.1 cytochrome c oxidase subunit 3 [Nitrosomonas nitrosa]
MSQGTGHYYVPAPSKWPIVGSAALFFLGFGAVFTMNKMPIGYWSLAIGFAILIYMLFGWFGDVARESESGKYGKQEDKAFRWGMSWFIFSEVMFFAAFFGALFYMRVLSIPWLADAEHDLLWPEFAGGWPTAGPGITEQFTPMGAWGLPAINTFLLLSSGVTVTLAHWALKENKREALKMWLLATIALGFIFLGCQIYEYGHAYADLNLKLTSGAYGSTFFMLTGFHGFHVTLGAIMLTVIYFRCAAGHFKPENHFGFEGVAWYWHFVDVVWLGLFIFVYLV